MTKILVTGGSGFLARSFRSRFSSKYEVTCLGRAELDLLNTSQVENCLKNGHFDVVIHTANYDAAPAFTTKNRLLVLEQNLKMFFNIARCTQYFGKMLFFGSGAEFGRENWFPKMSEAFFDVHVPTDQYGLSKYTMTRYAHKSSNIYNLRLFGVMGEWDDWRYRFVSLACCKAAFDMPITYRQNVFFDFIYIEDLLNIIEWFMVNEPKHKVYNVCTGESHDYQSIAEKIRDISGKDIEIRAEQPGLNAEYSGDNSLLMKEMSDYKFMPFDEALKRMYEWTAKNWDTIDPTGFEY